MLEGFQNPIIGMFELDNKHLVINFNEPILLIWAWNASAKSKANSNTYSVGKSALTCVVKHSEDNILAGCEDGKIYRLQPSRSEKPVMEYSKHTDVVFAMEIINANKFVSNSTDFKLVMWDINSGQVLKSIEVAGDMVMQMFYEKEQDLLIFSSLDGKIRAVDL
jgi:WD40 repeat protein